MGFTTNQGIVSPADITIILDALGAELKNGWAALGLGLDSESTTLSAKGKAARNKVLGDGTTSNVGIANTNLKTLLAQGMEGISTSWRWDKRFASEIAQTRLLINSVAPNLPSTWKFTSSSYRTFDLWLARCNASLPGTPATPSFTPNSTATTGGANPPTTSGQEPRFKLTYVGASDWLESQPTGAITLAALSGKNTAWTIGNFPGTVPSGVTKVRLYRQEYNSGSNDPYGYDSEVSVTAGSAFPTITLTGPDANLRMDVNPPSWMQQPLLPEGAALLMLTNATFSDDGTKFKIPTLNTVALVPREIVSMNPGNGFLGYNPSSASEFGRWSATTYTEGAILTANTLATGLQGYFGAAGGLVQVRVVSALNSNATITAFTYNYYDASSPTTEVTTGSWSGSVVLNSALGSTQTFSGIATDRVITRIKTITLSGATTGVFVTEAQPVRSI